MEIISLNKQVSPESNNLEYILNKQSIHPPDDTKRDISYTILNNVQLIGRNNFYPNVLLLSNNKLYSPYDEKIMSLNKDTFYDNNIYPYDLKNKQNIIANNICNYIEPDVFFFIYNFDNYYHFLYDTLPYLYAYLHLKQSIPNLKLLINYPNKDKTDFYKFNKECLSKFVDWTTDVIIHQETIASATITYSKIYISSSLTHGSFSNNKPRPEAKLIYKQMIPIQLNNCFLENQKIYISRRTWVNNKLDNIGTNYTTRRKMINEDLLVDKLIKLGFVEIFSENLSMDDKINLFLNSKIIVGCIGGGLTNLLFSSKKTTAVCIVTPYFLEINYRAKYSMESSNLIYFEDTLPHITDNKLPLYCRIVVTNLNSIHNNKIGEIIGYEINGINETDDIYKISLSNNDVAGFNQETNFLQVSLKQNEFKLLDKGLNSPFIIDIPKLLDLLQTVNKTNNN